MKIVEVDTHFTYVELEGEQAQTIWRYFTIDDGSLVLCKTTIHKGKIETDWIEIVDKMPKIIQLGEQHGEPLF